MTEPTDAELLALIEKHLGLKPRRDDTVIDPRTGRFHDVQRYRDLKADILAKWGAPPAVAGEPVAEVISTNGLEAEFTCEMLHGHVPALGAVVYLAAPQPTQAQAGAVPLTDADIDHIADRLWEAGYISCLTTETGRNFARAIETAHGIKGGQHG